MKAKIKIPKGWRRLRRNENLRRGDKFPVEYSFGLKWETTFRQPGDKATGLNYGFYIRRIKAAKPSRSKRRADQGEG